MIGRLATCCLLLLAAAAVTAQQPTGIDGAAATGAPAVDAAFTRFFDAHTAAEISGATAQIVASGVGFDEAFIRLERGRMYSASAPRGVIQASYRDDTVEYFYTLLVPDTYTPTRHWQVRVQLHGGVGRIPESAAPRGAPTGRLDGAEQIVVLPYAWRDAPWWSGRQEQNLLMILDLVKRTYNVDENRVALSGVSDGGTGAYYMAMRQTTPFASVLPLNGFFMVLKNEMAASEGDLFPNNLRNKPLFVVNGGRDPLYPTSTVDPFIDHLSKGGVDLVYKPQPNAAHDTSWWPEVKGTFEQFVTAHPRRPLPDTLTWSTGAVPARAHWLVIDRLRPAGSDDAALADVNQRSSTPTVDFGIRASGTRVNRVIAGSNAQQFGVRSGDEVTSINNQPAGPDTELAEVLRGFPEGRPLLLTVQRAGRSVRLTGRYAPTVLAGEAESMFPPTQDSGRVDLVRTGNRVEAKTRGVATFTLLVSPRQFDLDRPITVVVNGRTVVERTVRRDLSTLLKWAARDNDRTMLFGAELVVDLTN
jgi:hypothetical protein